MSHEMILVIEDEADILEVIQYNLNREGFRTVCVRDGEEGLILASEKSPDLVLLDLMLPGMDGTEICRRLRLNPLTQSTPIIMVTAKDETSDIVLGLGLGADDYITKPFSPKELMARVKAVLRRRSSLDDPLSQEHIVHGNVTIDVRRHELKVDQNLIALTATQFRLLHFLASHSGHVFTREQLMHQVIADNAIVIDRNIDVHIRSIRKKLGEYRDMIETIRGVGYRFREKKE